MEAENLLKGFKAHGADGELIEGACTFDVDTSEATAKAAEILTGKTAGVKGAIVTGTMPNRGGAALKITDKDASVPIQQGYHDGSGAAAIADTEKAKLIPDNIRQGVTILGVVGEMSGTEDVKAQSKTATPSTEQQAILPDIGYNYLTQVTIAPIPYEETPNAAGGTTVTIG